MQSHGALFEFRPQQSSSFYAVTSRPGRSVFTVFYTVASGGGYKAYATATLTARQKRADLSTI